jgi:hypothetical protein
MNKFSYTFTIAAKEKAEAEGKLKALSVLAGKLSLKELKKLADVVENNPAQTTIAKKFLGL